MKAGKRKIWRGWTIENFGTLLVALCAAPIAAIAPLSAHGAPAKPAQTQQSAPPTVTPAPDGLSEAQRAEVLRAVQAAANGTMAAAGPPNARPAIWRISDRDTTIYLFGTVHLLSPTTNWHTPTIENALAHSNEIVLEIADLDSASAMMGPYMLAHGLLPFEQNLRSLISPNYQSRYDQIRSQLPNNLGPMVDRMRPWLAYITLGASQISDMGLDANAGVDRTIEAYGRRRNIPIISLETAGQQMDIFSNLPEAESLALINDMLRNWDQGPAEMNGLMSAWTRGDAEQVGRIMNQAMTQTPNFFNEILTRRNQNWAAWIDDRLDRPGTVFIAVGAGHLAGSQSVQRQLTRRHIRAVRLRN